MKTSKQKNYKSCLLLSQSKCTTASLVPGSLLVSNTISHGRSGFDFSHDSAKHKSEHLTTYYTVNSAVDTGMI